MTAVSRSNIPDLDWYSYYDHRIGEVGSPVRNSWLAPQWLPQSASRRLSAYRYLDALNKNSSRWYLPTDDEDERRKIREYGDAELFGDRLASGVLGDRVEIVVDGADNEPSAAPPLPPRPLEPSSDDPIDRQAYEASVRVWRSQSAQIIEDWEQTWDERNPLIEGQKWLREWDNKEHFTAKLYELESQFVVPLGDGVATFQWDSRVGRPTMTLYPPDAYHPVLDELEDGAFPDRIHLAWEYEDALGATWVRRITYELLDVEPWRPPYLPVGQSSNRRCFVSDGRWRIEQFEDRTIEDLTEAAAVWNETTDGEVMQELPLPLDFIPVLHVPNGFATVEHFGRSSFASGCQILEQISQADTDAANASDLAGTPQVAVSGTSVPSALTVKAGTVWSLGDSGRMDVIDQGSSLRVLIEYRQKLQEIAERMMRVPAGVLGRESMNEARSGIALIIENFPYEQEVQKLRLTRESKYRMALKWVQRIAIAGNAEGINQVSPARVAFGAHLPSDLSTTVDQVETLLRAQAISRATGLRMLVDAGLDLDDAARELDRIRSEDTEGAVEVAQATGSQETAATYLGVEVAPTDPDLIDQAGTDEDDVTQLPDRTEIPRPSGDRTN